MDAARLENLLGELFSLEINTILKQGMTATKMPNVAHAFIDIARDYSLVLNQVETALYGTAIAKPDLPERVEKPDEKTGTFNDLRERAARLARDLQGLPEDVNQAAQAPPPKPPEGNKASQLLMLCRIRDTSDQLKPIVPNGASFGRHEATDLDIKLGDKELLILRKAWELGTEEVVMQTVVYLDGDVMTRIRPDLASAENRSLLDVHQQSVNTSIGFWRGLVDVVRAIFGAAVGAGAPGGK